MRTTALALLALTLVTFVPGVAAQPPSFSEPYQVRGAVGDIPTTTAVEASAMWNLEQRLVVQFDNASAEADRTYQFALPAGSTLVNATCDCARSRTLPGALLSVVIEPQTASGQRTITVATRQPLTAGVGLGIGFVYGFTFLPSPDAPAEQALILYVPGGSDLDSNVDFASPGSTTDSQSVIHYAQFDASRPMPGSVWVTMHPATTAVDTPSGDGRSALDWLLPVIVGLVLGMIVWAMLVSRGLVQKKSRKQLTSTAAHVEAAAADPPAVLEGKKRALLAALKEVELARQANEMPVEVYDVVKADLKKQAVTVMRALESSSGEAKS